MIYPFMLITGRLSFFSECTIPLAPLNNPSLIFLINITGHPSLNTRVLAALVCTSRFIGPEIKYVFIGRKYTF